MCDIYVIAQTVAAPLLYELMGYTDKRGVLQTELEDFRGNSVTWSRGETFDVAVAIIGLTITDLIRFTDATHFKELDGDLTEDAVFSSWCADLDALLSDDSTRKEKILALLAEMVRVTEAGKELFEECKQRGGNKKRVKEELEHAVAQKFEDRATEIANYFEGLNAAEQR